MTAADIFDTAVGVFRAYPLTLALAGMLTVFPLVIFPMCALFGVMPLALYAPDGAVAGRQTAVVAGVAVACGVLALAGIGAVAALFQSAAVADLTSQALHGARPSLRAAYGRAARRWASLLMAAVVLFGANFAAGFLGVVPCLGLLAGVALQAVLTALLGFAWQAIVLEEMDGIEALRRSAQLASPAFPRVFLLQTAAGLLVGTIAIGPGMLALTLLNFVPPWIPLFLLGALAVVVFSISAPFAQVVGTVLYYDLRIRQEGYDLKLQAERLLAGGEGT